MRTSRAPLLATLALGVGCRRAPPRAADTAQPPAAHVAPDASPRGDATAPPPQDASPSRTCVPWATLGRGVSVRRCAGGAGHAAVLLAGWNIRTDSARAWADALDDARLRELGVSTLYAVEGPAHVDFRGKELAIDALLADLTARDAGRTSWVLTVAHSSGAYVAATLFDRAFRAGRAPSLRGRMVYVDLDGDRGIAGDPERSLTPESVAGLRHIVFVAVEDTARRVRGFSRAAMEDGHRAFPQTSELMVYDAAGSGCTNDTCAHLALINTRPYARGNESYARYEQGPVNTAWLTRAERWLAE